MRRVFFTLLIIIAGCAMPTESNFKIKIVGSHNIKFAGSYMIVTSDGQSSSHTVDGVVPAEYDMKGWIISCSFQKQSEQGSLSVIVYRNGQLINQSTTTAAYGVVTIATRGDVSTPAASNIDKEQHLPRKDIEPPKAKKEVKFDPIRMSKEGYLDAKWGMTKQEVIDITGASPSQNGAYLEGEIVNTKVAILYEFIQDRLYEVIIPIKLKENTLDVTEDMAKFSEIESLLLDKYGKAKRREKSRNNPYIPYSTAISLGQGFYRTKWETPESRIMLYLGGDMTKINHLLVYESKKYAPLARKEKKKKAKEKL
jgi:hypothetical protein